MKNQRFALNSIAGLGLTMLALAPTSAKAQSILCTPVTTVPYVMTTPGVYCLDRDLVYSGSGTAIEVQTSHVTLDLNGYALRGPWQGVGIAASNRAHVTVKNGTVRGFARGVSLRGFTGGAGSYDQGHVVENVNVDWSKDVGIEVEGAGTIVRGNRVFGTTGPVSSGDSYGIRLVGARVQVIGNDVAETYGSGDGDSYAIHANTLGAVIEGNRVGNVRLVSNTSFGIAIAGAETLVVGNRLSTLDRGIVFLPAGSGKYRDNLASGVTVPYEGGTDSGNNQ